jgi:hypothetical protein
MGTEAEDLLAMLSDSKASVHITPPRLGANLGKQAEDEKELTEESSDADLSNLNKIIETKNQIAQVKKHLSTIIDSIAANPSLISGWSQFWGDMPLWKKVGTGAAITVPAILTGVAASLTPLLVLGGVTGIAYTASGMVLQDHFECSENIKQRLRDGISSIADILEITIVALDNVRVRLSEQIGRFKEANADLAKKVGTLQDQINTLSIKIEILIGTSTVLDSLKSRLELRVYQLEQDSEQQKDLLDSAQKELTATITDYKNNQKNLEHEVTELRRVRVEMFDEIAKTKKVSEALQAVIGDLSEQVVENNAQKQVFNSRLHQLCDKEEQSVRTVVDRLSKTQQELDDAKKSLCANNKQNKELLARQEVLIQKIEGLGLDAIKVVRKDYNKASFFNPQSDAALVTGRITSGSAVVAGLFLES